jgi:type VI secretion system VasD/TssJ family lipoprotein
MKSYVGSGIVFMFCFVIFSCASRPPEFTYEREAVALRLKAEAQLNVFQNRSHTLLVCIYQLRDPNSFNQILDEGEGISKLLECTRFDASVSTAKKLVLQPGQETIENLDRADGAKYIGVLAGYYDLKRETSSRLYKVPVSYLNQPEKVTIDLILGPRAIQDRVR